MKICCLKGSPRKNGNTNALTDIVLEKLTEEGAAVNTFSLYEMEIKPCLACRKCQEDWTKVTCARQDDMEQIFTAVMECDILLLSTPIYSWYCTAPMKAALDRMVYALNMYYGEQRGPSLWEGKQLALITTCGYPPEKGTDLLEEGIRRYCKHSKLQYMGILCERHQGYHIPFMDEAKKEHAEAFARKLVQVQTEKGID
ncbi:MAG: flavodoxin family protein [Clostridium sp.]|jgi:multimeric flavodoxin WrbA|nr:flavodoxin family protein [Clostridium sp.]